ncbi:hypothetical protein [Streptomyces sp. NPDC054784]
MDGRTGGAAAGVPYAVDLRDCGALTAVREAGRRVAAHRRALEAGVRRDG